jgi:hypothetical protein
MEVEGRRASAVDDLQTANGASDVLYTAATGLRGTSIIHFPQSHWHAFVLDSRLGITPYCPLLHGRPQKNRGDSEWG